jgi:hypothetical protein
VAKSVEHAQNETTTINVHSVHLVRVVVAVTPDQHDQVERAAAGFRAEEMAWVEQEALRVKAADPELSDGDADRRARAAAVRLRPSRWPTIDGVGARSVTRRLAEPDVAELQAPLEDPAEEEARAYRVGDWARPMAGTRPGWRCHCRWTSYFGVGVLRGGCPVAQRGRYAPCGNAGKRTRRD